MSEIKKWDVVEVELYGGLHPAIVIGFDDDNGVRKVKLVQGSTWRDTTPFDGYSMLLEQRHLAGTGLRKPTVFDFGRYIRDVETQVLYRRGSIKPHGCVLDEVRDRVRSASVGRSKNPRLS